MNLWTLYNLTLRSLNDRPILRQLFVMIAQTENEESLFLPLNHYGDPVL